jgi:hypothetical protein
MIDFTRFRWILCASFFAMEQVCVHDVDFYCTGLTFQLCVSFRLLNAVTRPMQFPIPRCDDEAEKMGNCEVAITAELDAGYWQVLMHKYARDKTGFFTPDGKKHFCQLPMGIKNAAPFFVDLYDVGTQGDLGS